MKTNDLKEVFREGYEAFWEGCEVNENPYIEDNGIDLFNEWRAGWFEAYLETK